MKMKLLLTLMLTAAVSSSLSAQDMEQTMPPTYYEGGDYSIWQDEQEEDYSHFILSSYTCVYFENADEADATIYYRRDKGYGFTDWEEYVDGNPVHSMGLGETTVEAYAVAEGKLPSETVTIVVCYYDMPHYEAFLVDGIHYYNDFSNLDWHPIPPEVYVCSMYESKLGSEPYSGDIVIPSEVAFRYPDSYYTVVGVRNAAFASTFAATCDITSIDLPSTITQIGYSSFGGCINMKRMIVRATTPPTAGYLFSDDYIPDVYNYYGQIGFDGNTLYDQVTLFVPSESLEDYRTAWEWKKFTHIVPFVGAGPGDINGDGNIAINDVTGLIDQLLGGEELPAWSDVDGDGNVSIKDVTALIDQLLSGN